MNVPLRAHLVYEVYHRTFGLSFLFLWFPAGSPLVCLNPGFSPGLVLSDILKYLQLRREKFNVLHNTVDLVIVPRRIVTWVRIWLSTNSPTTRARSVGSFSLRPDDFHRSRYLCNSYIEIVHLIE